MGGKRPLTAGAIRMLGSHGGVTGRAFRRSYDALAEEFDLASASKLVRLEASRVALMWSNLEHATRALEALRLARERGRGRTPSARDVERAARRQGLADGSYSQALDKLRTMIAARPRGPATPDELRAQLGEREVSTS